MCCKCRFSYFYFILTVRYLTLESFLTCSSLTLSSLLLRIFFSESVYTAFTAFCKTCGSCHIILYRFHFYPELCKLFEELIELFLAVRILDRYILCALFKSFGACLGHCLFLFKLRYAGCIFIELRAYPFEFSLCSSYAFIIIVNFFLKSICFICSIYYLYLCITAALF